MAFDKISKTTTAPSRSLPKVDDAKIQQMIREKASSVWEGKGKPVGQDLAIWLEAEKQICAKYK